MTGHTPDKPGQKPSGPDEKPATQPEETGPIPSRAIKDEAERLKKAAAKRRAATNKPTERLNEEKRDDIPLASQLPFGTRIGSALTYIELPSHLAHAGLSKDIPRWRVELHDLSPGAGPLGVDIVGDMVIGRGAGGPKSPDLDLDTYGAVEHGVSRRHALLRPTRNRLYIIDLDSTNGTMLNAAPLGGGVARSLQDNDSLTLGNFTFTFKIIDGPGLQKETGVAKTGLPRGSTAKKTTKPLKPDETKPLREAGKLPDLPSAPAPESEDDSR